MTGCKLARAKALPLLPALALTILAPSQPLYAQHMNAPDAPCRDAGSGVEQSRCLQAAADETDAELNALYARIAAVLDAADRRRLRDAARAWLPYRDRTCAAEYALYGGGSGGLQARPACLAALTRHRIADLQAAYGWKLAKAGE